MRVGEVIHIQYPIKVPQSSFLDVLQHAISTGVPDSQVDEQVVVDSDLFESKLEAVGGSNVVGEVLLLAAGMRTSMQFSSDDLPTSLTPTMAMFTFYSLRWEKETSLSVSIE